MTETGFILLEKATGRRYRVCGCLQVFRDKESADSHREIFSEGDPDDWETIQVEVTYDAGVEYGRSLVEELLPFQRKLNLLVRGGG